MNLSSTDELLGIIEALDRPRAFLLDTFFKNEKTFDTQTINLDELDRAQQLAPFVSPSVAGKIQRNRGMETRTFTPAYVKPKHAIDPAKTLQRRAGERFAGELSPAARRDLIRADNLKIEDEQITRREEWMASQALQTGKTIVEGEDYPRKEIDFERNAAHTKVLSGAARWGETGVSPYKTVRGWATEGAKNSGVHMPKVIMDPLAAELFLEDPDLEKKLDNRRQMGGEAQLFGAATGAQGEEVAFLGRVGQFEFWQYSAIYVDEAGNQQNFLPDYTVLMGSEKLEGVRCYGAILDHDSLVPLSRFPKEWRQDDPSVDYTMTQSAPLPVPQRPDASMCITVR